MKALILAETEEAARELSVGARTVCDHVSLVAVGPRPFTGVADVCFHIAVPEGYVADDAYPAVNDVFDRLAVQIVLAQCSAHMVSLIGRLASHTGNSVIAGAMGFEGSTATSLYYGGVGVRRAKPKGPYGFYTVDAGVFDGSLATGTKAVEEVAFQAPAVAMRRIGAEPVEYTGADLSQADVIVSCGRGFAAEDDLQLARDLADACNGELACSRPLTEAVQWFPRSSYVGVSGQTVSPGTYFAVGISGQMQHIVGCERSRSVIAVNKDKDAPIFGQCDLGIVGDLKTVLPALTEAISR